jgi:hypothetical protein
VPSIGRRDRPVPEGLPHGPAIYAFRNRADGRLYIGKSFKATRRNPRPPQPSRVPQTSQPPIAAGLRQTWPGRVLTSLPSSAWTTVARRTNCRWPNKNGSAASSRPKGRTATTLPRLRPNSAAAAAKGTRRRHRQQPMSKSSWRCERGAGQPENPARDAGRLAKLVVGAPRPRPLRLQCRHERLDRRPLPGRGEGAADRAGFGHGAQRRRTTAQKPRRYPAAGRGGTIRH